MCSACHATRVKWLEAPKTGTIFSYSVAHHPTLSILRDYLPYIIALVIFPELDDVRLVTNIVGANPAAIEVGAEVVLHWENASNGIPLPRFRLKR